MGILSVYAPDAVERSLIAAAAGTSIPQARGLMFTVPVTGLGGGWAWTPATGNPAFALFSNTDVGVTTLTGTAITNITEISLVNFTDLTDLELPVLTVIDANHASSVGFVLQPTVGAGGIVPLTTVNAPLLTTIPYGALNITGATLLSTFNLPRLATIGGVLTFSGNTSAPPAIGLALSLPALATVAGLATITSNPGLVQISFPALITASLGANISGNARLSSITLTSFVPTNGQNYSFASNALTNTALNNILAAFVNNAGYVSGTITLSGGTNAGPTGATSTKITTLTGRGVTVNHN